MSEEKKEKISLFNENEQIRKEATENINKLYNLLRNEFSENEKRLKIRRIRNAVIYAIREFFGSVINSQDCTDNLISLSVRDKLSLLTSELSIYDFEELEDYLIEEVYSISSSFVYYKGLDLKEEWEHIDYGIIHDEGDEPEDLDECP